MESWQEICNLRSDLLHMQFLHASLQDSIEQQQEKVQRAHRDRLVQYWKLWEEWRQLESSNFKRIIILKLEACLGCHEYDDEVWELLDRFENYAKMVETQMLEQMSKLYIGSKAMFNIQEVQQQLVIIQEKVANFLSSQTPAIQEYHSQLQKLEQTRSDFNRYLQQIHQLYFQIEGGYPRYLERKLKIRSQQIDANLKTLKANLLC